MAMCYHLYKIVQPPRLQQRPGAVLLNPLDVSTPIGSMPPPSSAGPITAKLNQNAVKVRIYANLIIFISFRCNNMDKQYS